MKWDESTDYRKASIPTEPKESMLKNFFNFLFHDLYPVNVIVAGIFVGLGLTYAIVYAAEHERAALASHAEYDRYWLNHDRCQARSGWYVPSENYYRGLVACRRLDDHSLFYLVPDTGFAVIPMVED
jgi:hypothetical protein